MSDLKVLLVVAVTLMILQETPRAEGGDSPQEDALFREVVKTESDSGNKITVVGAGKVGMAVAFSLITQYVTDEIVLIDRIESESLVKGEVQDLQHGSGFIKSPKISGGSDYALTKNSRIVIVTAGVNQKEGQSRLDLLEANLKVFRAIIPKVKEHSPNAVIIVVTNPVDIMTYVTWQLMGKENTNRIIGSGTNLDSSRLQFLISQDLHISPESVHGWVIGEHGDSSVTAWSGVNVAGVNLKNLPNLDKEMADKMKGDQKGGISWFDKIHNRVQESAYEIIKQKGYTSWAVGLSVANLAYSIIHNVRNVHAVSTMVKGLHGIEDEVFLSLPCVLGENGVTHIIKQPLEAAELEKLKASAKIMRENIDKLDFNKQ